MLAFQLKKNLFIKGHVYSDDGAYIGIKIYIGMFIYTLTISSSLKYVPNEIEKGEIIFMFVCVCVCLGGGYL